MHLRQNSNALPGNIGVNAELKWRDENDLEAIIHLTQGKDSVAWQVTRYGWWWWGIASGLHHGEASVFPAAQSQQYMWRVRLQRKLVGISQSHYSQGMYM